MVEYIIVSRHAAAVEFIAQWLLGIVDGDGVTRDWEVNPNWPGEVVSVVRDGNAVVRVDGIPIYKEIFPGQEDLIRGKAVLGNLPLHLAALTEVVFAVEFTPGKAPRGQEYTVEDMKAAGAKMVPYRVTAISCTPP
jgi:hypothetical protein